MDFLTVAVTGILCILCFKLGAELRPGDTKERKEVGNFPNPIKVIDEARREREIKREKKRADIIMRNIEAYDGTAEGQEEIDE